MGEVGCWQRSVSALSQTWASPEFIERERDLRVGGFEKALAIGNLNATQLEELGLEIVRRRERWLTRWHGIVLDHDFINTWNLFTAKQEQAGLSMLVASPLLWLWYSLRHGAGFGTTAKLRRTLLTGDCPDCGHNLLKAKTAFPQSNRTRMIGPVNCPECGSLWPLVPPPNAGEPMSTNVK